MRKDTSDGPLPLPVTRRLFVVGGGLALAGAAAGCGRDAPRRRAPTPAVAVVAPETPSADDHMPIVETLVRHPLDELTARLAAHVRAGASPLMLSRAASHVALRRCRQRTAAGWPPGYLSHALLAIGPALRLAALLPEERAAVPTLVACHFVARESRGGPYGPALSLDDVEATAPDGDAQDALVEAVRAMNGERAEGIAAHLLDEDEHQTVLAAVHRLGMTWLGHVGHGLIMATQVDDLCTAYGGQQRELLRAPVRYLASFRVPDESERRAREALGPISGGNIAGQVAEALQGGADPERLATLITDAAASILVRYRVPDGGSLVMPIHLLTACHAAHRAVAQGADNRADDRDLLVRVATWLDMAVAGETELGAFQVSETMPTPAGSWDVQRFVAAVGANDLDAAAVAVPGMPELDPDFAAYATELACVLARPTLLHSLKALDAVVREHASARTERARFSYVSAFARLVAAETAPQDTVYHQMIEAMGLDPHPLIGS